MILKVSKYKFKIYLFIIIILEPACIKFANILALKMRKGIITVDEFHLGRVRRLDFRGRSL